MSVRLSFVFAFLSFCFHFDCRLLLSPSHEPPDNTQRKVIWINACLKLVIYNQRYHLDTAESCTIGITPLVFCCVCDILHWKHVLGHTERGKLWGVHQISGSFSQRGNFWLARQWRRVNKNKDNGVHGIKCLQISLTFLTGWRQYEFSCVPHLHFDINMHATKALNKFSVS